MKGTRIFSYALLSLVVGANSAAYAQGGKDKKADPQAAKQGEQPHDKTPPGQAKQSAPPARVQPAAQQHQRSQAPPPLEQATPGPLLNRSQYSDSAFSNLRRPQCSASAFSNLRRP